jgi:hypothetical protein
MTCQSIAPEYKFKYVEPVNQWPNYNRVPKDVFDNSKFPHFDPLKRIMGFTSTLGLGDQSSILSIDMSGHHGEAKDMVGRIAIFECDEFNFGGMIKSVVKTEDRSGPKTKITMTDMKEAMARYDIMINEWSGTTNVVFSALGGGFTSIKYTGWNTTNALRAIESQSYGTKILSQSAAPFGERLPDMNTNDCSAYGKSTDEGAVARGETTYKQILDHIHPMWFNTASYPLSISLGHLRRIAEEIPYVGTSAKTMTLLELINNVCEEAGYDWSFHRAHANYIYMDFIDKKEETPFGLIENRIALAQKEKKLISSSVGVEFKNEKTRRVVIGSKVQYIKELQFETNTEPAGFDRQSGNQHGHDMVLGFYADNSPIRAGFDFNVAYDTTMLSATLEGYGYPGLATSLSLSEAELLATGTLATWKLFGIMYPGSISGVLMRHLGMSAASANAKVINSLNSSTHMSAMAAVEAVKFLTKKSASAMVYEEIGYSWIKHIYDTYYGKYYLVNIPKTTCGYDPTGFFGNTGVFLGSGSSASLADEPTSSGWADTSTALNLSNNTLFLDSSGKLNCFCAIERGDFANRTIGAETRSFEFEHSLFQGDSILTDTHMYTRAEVDGRAYQFGDGYLRVLIKMPNMIPQRAVVPSISNTMGLRALDIIIGGSWDGTSQNGGTTDFSYTNVFKETLAAGRMARIAVPMKSNVVNYGAWLSHDSISPWDDGGVELKHVEDLNPWSYGGYGNMSTAGKALATEGLKKRHKYESGSIVVAGTPSRGLSTNGYNETQPIVASIVCKMDADGVTTTYNYQTYTQKFGQSAETFNNYTKLNIGSRRANFNILKQNSVDIISAFSEGRRTFGAIREKLFQQGSVPLSVSSSSLNNILIMSYPDDDGNNRRIEAGIDKKYTSDYFQDGDNYNKYAIVSLDMIFSPVVANPSVTSDFMPSMSEITQPDANYVKNATAPRLPPINKNNEILSIQNLQLNPYTTAAMMTDFGTAGGGVGFRTEYISFGDTPNNTFATSAADVAQRDQATDIRAAALRGPLLLHSWGYDTNGQPVPGLDSETFSSDWLSQPETWPCGPIDLRWDPARAVWVSPPSASLVIAQLKNDLPVSGSATATVKDNPMFYTYPIQDPNAEIEVFDFIGESIPAGSNIIAYHFGSGATYIPLTSMGQSYARVKGEGGGCVSDGIAPGTPVGPLDGYLEGYGPNGIPVLYSIKELVGGNLGSSTQTRLLGYTSTNRFGGPCMTSIPIVDCSGDYPGSPNTPGLPPVDSGCPPDQVWDPRKGKCIGF